MSCTKDNFKEYAVQHKLLPLSFFIRLSADIRGYYIPTYLFNGEVDIQWLATHVSEIKNPKAAERDYDPLEDGLYSDTKPVASNSVSEFSVLAPSCQYGKIPTPLWDYLNGYNFDITRFRSNIEKCDNAPTAANSGIELQTIDNDDAVVWEDYAKQAVMRNANSKKKIEMNEVGLVNSRINCVANREEITHIVYLPCWCAQIQFNNKKYFAVTVANDSLKNLSCYLPDSWVQKVVGKLWNILNVFLFVVFPIYLVKYAKIFAQTYLGYTPRSILCEPLILLACWIAVFILGIVVWKKIQSLIVKIANKFKVLIVRGTFSSSRLR